MSYESIAAASQILAMILFGSVIVGVLIYVFRPSNTARFDAAARRALEHDDSPPGEANGKGGEQARDPKGDTHGDTKRDSGEQSNGQ